MKRWITHWLLPLAPRSVGIALALALLPLAGCVSLGKHREVVAERDALGKKSRGLQEHVRRLEASNESLDKERVDLLEKTEDLRELRANLERDVQSLRKKEAELSQGLMERDARLSELEELSSTYEGLVSDLESEVASGQIEIEQLREGVRLKVSDEILFASGSSRLGTAGTALLRKVAPRLLEIPNLVEIQGHTDDIPIRGSLAKRFPSNWELAAARASSVVRLFESVGVTPGRLTAVSYGEFAPVAPNDSADNRALNRRIEIRLLPPGDDAPNAPASP